MDTKHARYLEHHIPGEVFWGLGVENETYVELYAGAPYTTQRKRERYSVDYWSQYKTQPPLPIVRDQRQRLPLLANSHTFTKCDPYGEHKTLYTRNPPPNPKFGGRTLLEVLEVTEPEVFGPAARDIWWCFDGDTVEFMTQAFRCATVTEVVAELIAAKQRWMTALRRALATIPCEPLLKGPIGWPAVNHGLAVYLTNRGNVATFNNGTYHINITAPTRLGKEGEIADWPRFLQIHRQAARLFQWLSPFLVAAYGSPDPFAQMSTAYPAGSQRLAASRYVSVGTYDTRTMTQGKLLTGSAEMPTAQWWREMYADRNTGYEPLDAIGYDIQFHKFGNHGLEFRIFDWIPEERLWEVLDVLVAMMDRAIAAKQEIPYPQDSRIWRKVMGRAVWEGASALLNVQELRVFSAVLGVPLTHHGLLECSTQIRRTWLRTPGPCVTRMCLRPYPFRGDWMEEFPEMESRPRRIESLRTPIQLHLRIDQHIPHVASVSVGCRFPYFFGGRRTIPSLFG